MVYQSFIKLATAIRVKKNITNQGRKHFESYLMLKHHLITVAFILLSVAGFSQVTPKDTVAVSSKDDLEIDTSFNYDELLDDMAMFLDSLLMPRSYFLASVSVSNNYFNYWRRNFTKLEAIKKNLYSPVLGYYHKSGPGLTITGNITDDETRANLYQFSVSPSFDFIQSSNWIAGVSYVRYFTKDSLPFYTSPLQNEFNAYFIWRKSWVQPGLTLSYGHGSRTDFNERERYIKFLRRRKPGQIVGTTSTNETVADFAATATVRHSFYWMRVLGKKDYIKLTPQIAFSAGTQKFGFNRTSSIYTVNLRNAANLLYNTGDVNVDNELKFQPLSLALYLRPEYAIGKFFIQPQFILDYYFPAEDLSAVFSLNAGVVF